MALEIPTLQTIAQAALIGVGFGCCAIAFVRADLLSVPLLLVGAPMLFVGGRMFDVRSVRIGKRFEADLDRPPGRSARSLRKLAVPPKRSQLPPPSGSGSVDAERPASRRKPSP